MGSVTAQITFGTAHPNHGGIYPEYLLELRENSRPVWVLMEHPDKIYRDRRNNRESKFEPISWIPTREGMLEDALLMIGIYVLRDHFLVSVFNRTFGNSGKLISLYSGNSAVLEEMRNRCRELEYDYKIVVSVLEGSTIRRQIKILEEYKMDVEVTVPVYSRHYSHWTKETEIRGQLSDPFFDNVY